MNLLLMADRHVGDAITHWLLGEFPEDLALVVATSKNDIWEACENAGIPCVIYESSEQIARHVEKMDITCDLGICAWWPELIKRPLLDMPRHGFINTHPSLLPYNRGKHYNFWAIVEEAPFGTSLHIVDEGVDSGGVIAQKPIPYDWEDSGESLYYKALEATVQLFQENYSTIRKLDIKPKKQNLKIGSYHKADELDAASRIELDRNYRARDLLNLLRARTFHGYPACWFEEGDEIFEVRVEIKRKSV